MRWLTRLFGKHQASGNRTLEDPARGLYRINSTHDVRFRQTTLLTGELQEGLLEVCRREQCVREAYFLDMMEPPSTSIKLLIALRLDDPDTHQIRVMEALREVLTARSFEPEFFIGVDPVSNLEAKHPAYVRGPT
jgi:hypothetical protein